MISTHRLSRGSTFVASKAISTLLVLLALFFAIGHFSGCADRQAAMMSTHERDSAEPRLYYQYRRPTSPSWNQGAPERESYDFIHENRFADPRSRPLSTFAIDVDTASYSNVRRFIDAGEWPPAGAVRLEECVNYFDYAYAEPKSVHEPFAVHFEIADCPWERENRLALIGIKGLEIDHDERPAANLVFVIDVSGSMKSDDKLPLLKRSLSMLVRDMCDDDSIGIVVYSGSARTHLKPTHARKRERILRAIDELDAGGSTNGAGGLELGYDMADEHFIRDGINRVLIATDGDFNVGTTSEHELVNLIEQKRRTGVFLSVLGFGTGNLKDDKLEAIADHGNGNYAYIDSLHEARRVLVDRMGSTLVTIAKDVKIQVEFNPAEVQAYRLLGYENRMLAAHEFNDDRKDGGEIGAGHCVTALYEIVPIGAELRGPWVDELKYQRPSWQEHQHELELLESAMASGELGTVKLRYKLPDENRSSRLTYVLQDDGRWLSETSDDFRWAAAVAEFCMLLRDSEHLGMDASFEQVIELARGARSRDRSGDRAEFIKLALTAAEMREERLTSLNR